MLDKSSNDLSLNEKNPSSERTPFGKEMLKHFSFEPGYRNMNHGSFGTFPIAIRDKATEFRNECEARPCAFIKFEYPKLLDASRVAVSKVLNAPLSTVVFVPNATTGVNIVLRNITWNPDGKDEILQFNIIYDACEKTTEYISESTSVNGTRIVNARNINLTYPLSDADVVSAFKSAVAESRSSNRRPRVAIFDTVVSQPGVRFPFESLIAACRSENILSLIDGAHGIGHVDIDLSALDPDFLVSNCHKWLFVPRGCAVFYVPERNQALMRSTLPTSHGFQPLSSLQNLDPKKSQDPNQKSAFVEDYEFIGTMDYTPFLCVPEAIKWRQEVCGGEEKIRTYCRDLARGGGRRVAEILGTVVLDNEENTITNCCMVSVRLPLAVGEGDENTIKPDHVQQARRWMEDTLVADYKTFMPVVFFQGELWTRMSGQVYLDMEDFEWAGQTLKELCERVGKGGFLDVAKN